MLLRLFFAKRGEALSESYPQIMIMITVLFSAYHHFDTNKIPFFGYADVHVHRTYTECTPNVSLKHSQEAPEWKPEDRRSVQRGVP